ncbi:Beta-galactosidase [Stylophora pistillata]|uniref:Beta-galactosidase n=1 Tax=Stylophora pistillata TaxID=50429 RepID=A0A2B4RK98_STYPI|nr:Beta-galactosidase [Stylophora pistillata]
MSRYSKWVWKHPTHTDSKSFTIDYENDCFLKDGEPFRYISGSLHYVRVPRFYWKDRLLKMKAGGLNTVQTYIHWNIHEPVRGQYNFEGNADLVSFIELANSLGLLVIVRAGPYICAELDFGGFPAWLLKDPSIRVRSSEDKRFLDAVDSWMSVVLPKLQPLLYVNGGPIISVQVENEYGSFFVCDHDYMKHLEQLFRKHLGDDVILFTVDSAFEFFFHCGTIPSLYPTIDFGPEKDPESAFALQRKFAPKGPLVNTEFYTGWIDYWGEKHQVKDASLVAKSLDKILSMNASVNFYMYEGGTNFGFMSGANMILLSYKPIPTSYDYDAPLTEAGDTGTKFHVLREVISKHEKIPIVSIPANTTKFAYGKVKMTRLFSFLDVVSELSAPHGPVNATFPLTMEQIGQNYGYILYRTMIPKVFLSSTIRLTISSLVRDRAIIYVGKIRQATMFRSFDQASVKLVVRSQPQLDILVENEGRINAFPKMVDPKGIFGNVTINGILIKNWQIYPINLGNVVSKELSHISGEGHENVHPASSSDAFAPAFFHGEIPLTSHGNDIHDTFLKVAGWSKGQAFVNGFNLGRYWPVVGPQQTLFVPANVLSMNMQAIRVVLLELDGDPCYTPHYNISTCFVEFVATPSINGPVHPIG